MTYELCSSLSVAAELAYRGFAEAAHRWIPLRVETLLVRRAACGHVSDAALRRELGGVALAFTLRYEYEPSEHLIRWSTDTSELMLAGQARFDSLSRETCLVRYQFSLDLPVLADTLIAELEDGIAHLVRDFRDHLIAKQQLSTIS